MLKIRLYEEQEWEKVPETERIFDAMITGEEGRKNAPLRDAENVRLLKEANQ